MSKGPKGRHLPSFRAEVALSAVRGEQTPAELAEHFGVRVDDVIEWRDRVVAGADRLFRDDRPAPDDSSERWVFALEASETGAWELNLADGSAWRSLLHDQIFGYVELPSHWDYDVFMQHVIEEDRERVDAAFRRALDERGDWTFECRIHRTDGEQRWIAGKGRVHCDDHERPIRMWGTVRDITGARQAEEALRRSEDRYRTLFESIDEGFCIIESILDANGCGVDYRFLEMNPAFQRHTGLADAKGKTARELVPDLEEHWPQIYGRIAVTGTPERFVNESEAMGRWFEVDAFRIGDPAERKVALLFVDVTERMRVEQALQESEERYRTLFKSMDEGFCVIERIEGDLLDFRYVEANPAFVKNSGITKVVGKTLRQVVPLAPEEWLQTYDDVLRSGEAVRFERELPAKGRVLELYAYRVEDQMQRRVAVLFRDVTGRKQVEAALREADRAKDEFLAVLGHELRNPLAPLRTGLDLLAQVARKPDILDSVRPMMERQLSHLVRLVNDLLDISRISQGKFELQQAPLDLNTPIEVAVEQLRPVITERRHELRLRLSDTPLPVDGDLERLTQVASNLLSNAAKYMKPGGTIYVSSAVERGQVVLRVRDAGFGIPADGFDKLFRMFSQIEDHRAQTGGGGLGIGLALTRQLIELHGGTIEVESEGLAQGSEFIVRLPMARGEAGAGVGARAARASIPARRVLIVDDNVDAAEGLRILLELDGHLVRAVHDGPAALEEVEEFQPDIVLLDLGLPGMDGIEVARRIRAMPGGDEVLIVAVTGWGQAEDRQRTTDAGFDNHLTKPIGAHQVQAMLVSGRHGGIN